MSKKSTLRRQQIAQALMSLMATEGYDGATIKSIAQHAELTPGLVHYHFSSKREILLHLLEQLMAQHRDKVTSALEAAGPRPWPRLDALIDALSACVR